ncbi:hypothetical protein T439DRAFT_384260 [Meredithblackwellia eburnea MCA 4105]
MPATIFISKGMTLIGQMIASCGTGIAFVQSYDYFTLYRKDPVGMKAFVGLLVTLLVFALITQTMSLYDTLITQEGVASPLFPLVHYLPLHTNVIAMGLGQGFFVLRTFRVWQSKVLAGGLYILVLFNTISWYFVNVSSQRTNVAKTPALKLARVTILNRWVVINSSTSAATDVLISGLLAWKLFEARRRGQGFSKHTDSMLSAMLPMTLGTAAVTTVIALYVVFTVKWQPLGSSYHLVLGGSTAVSSVCCVLYCLNSRQRLKLIQEGQTGSRSNDAVGVMGNVASRPQVKFGGGNNLVSGISIQLDTYTETQAHEQDRELDMEKKRPMAA